MSNGNPRIIVFENEKSIPLQPDDFDKYKSWIMDSLREQLKSTYNRAKEGFTIPGMNIFPMNKITVKTNLDRCKIFFSDKVFLGNPPFNGALGKLINEVSSLTLIYNRPDEFLSIMQLPEIWALFKFIGADDHFIDLLIRAEKTYFDVIWDKTLNKRVWVTRRSIIAIADALRAGKPIDLSNLIFYDNFDKHGKEIKAEGTIYPCEKSEGREMSREMSLFNHCNNEISLYLLYIILVGGKLEKVNTDVYLNKRQNQSFLFSSYFFRADDKHLIITICDSGQCREKELRVFSLNNEPGLEDIFYNDLESSAILTIEL